MDEETTQMRIRFGRLLEMMIISSPLHLNKSEFAERAELTPIQVSRILHGKSGTRRSTLPRIVAALGIGADYELVDQLYQAAGFTPPARAGSPAPDGLITSPQNVAQELRRLNEQMTALRQEMSQRDENKIE